jgi:hypothetical protein
MSPCFWYSFLLETGTQSLIEMSTRSREIMFRDSRARPVRRAHNLNISQPYRSPRPVTAITLLYFLLETYETDEAFMWLRLRYSDTSYLILVFRRDILTPSSGAVVISQMTCEPNMYRRYDAQIPCLILRVTAGSRTRDLPACRTGPQPLRYRLPHILIRQLAVSGRFTSKRRDTPK